MYASVHTSSPLQVTCSKRKCYFANLNNWDILLRKKFSVTVRINANIVNLNIVLHNYCPSMKITCMYIASYGNLIFYFENEKFFLCPKQSILSSNIYFEMFTASGCVIVLPLG